MSRRELEKVFFVPGIYTPELYPSHKHAVPLGQVDRVALSEVLADLGTLLSKARRHGQEDTLPPPALKTFNDLAAMHVLHDLPDLTDLPAPPETTAVTRATCSARRPSCSTPRTSSAASWRWRPTAV